MIGLLGDEDPERDAPGTACCETQQPLSEEAIALVLKQAEALADEWTGAGLMNE